MSKVLIAGGTGAIGKHLAAFLENKGLIVSILTRNKKLLDGKKYYHWNVEVNEIDKNCFTDVETIIQLAGAGIAEKRWSAKRKIEIVNSRVNSSNLLFESIRKNKLKIKTFISASGIGYYGSITNEQIFTENASAGQDFLANTCLQWEEAANHFKEIGIRTVKIRTGIVLMQNEGAFAKLMTPAKFGLAAVIGNGHQYFPWIHIDDLCGIYYKSICDENIIGAYNAVSPAETTNKVFTKTLCRVLRKPKFLPNIPSKVLKIIFGELASTLLNGSRVSPEKIMNSGFTFQFIDLNNAITNLIKSYRK